MDNYLIIAIIFCFCTRTVLTESSLQQQNANQDQLNPVNDHENVDGSAKDQDKRTIFNSNIANYGWAKHVGYHPSGFKYVLGYSPVDLKYSPVIRPISIKHHGYAYGKPRLHLHLKKPVVHVKVPRPVYHTGWRPARPILPVNVPPPPQHFVTKPVAIAKPVHIDHLHTHVDHVHVKPVQHVDHVHQVSVPHVDHIHEVPAHSVQVQHADHIHGLVQQLPVQHVHFQQFHQVPVQPVAVPPPLPIHAHHPIVPVAASAPFAPSPLFEVTKPNLGVLPLGSVFPSPILRNIPTAPAPLPLQPALIPQPVAPAAIPLPQPAPLPVPRPAIVPQPVYPPGTFVEYHGNTNFINLLKGHVPVLPQPHVNAVQPGLPHHFHLQYPQIPQNLPAQPQPLLPHEQHDVQTPFVPANHPHFFQHPREQPQFQQQLPVDAPTHFQSPDQVNSHNIYQQQLPVNSQSQFETEQDNQNFYQQQLPQDATAHFQPADQVSTQHFFRPSMEGQQGQFQEIDQTDNNENNGYVYQQPDISNLRQSIQPGQTDLQLPLHLPQHPGFAQSARNYQPDNFQDPQYSESVFRPSIQLEPPYKK